MPREDAYVYVEVEGAMYQRTVFVDGVRTTVGDNRFEIVADPHSDIWEQQAVQMLREWIRHRKKTLDM